MVAFGQKVANEMRCVSLFVVMVKKRFCSSTILVFYDEYSPSNTSVRSYNTPYLLFFLVEGILSGLYENRQQNLDFGSIVSSAIPLTLNSLYHSYACVFNNMESP